jgi:hypothetical protein
VTDPVVLLLAGKNGLLEIAIKTKHLGSEGNPGRNRFTGPGGAAKRLVVNGGRGNALFGWGLPAEKSAANAASEFLIILSSLRAERDGLKR